MSFRSCLCAALSMAVLCGTASVSLADEKKAADQTISVAEGKITLTAPENWVRKVPRSRIVEHEFAIPGEKGTDDGRFTVMGASGTVDANVERWIGQFSQPDGSATKNKAKTTKKTVGKREVHVVDIAGTYKDAPGGPFAGGKTIDREDYRMLAAIIVDPDLGQYFFKFYGPAKLVAKNEKEFLKMIEGAK